MGEMQRSWDLIEDLSILFIEQSMDQLDAADFKDKAGEIWDLVERAREITESA